MSQRLNRREALKAAMGSALSAALPGGPDQEASQASTGDDRSGISFVSDTGERFHLSGDGWALALGIADHYGWRLEPWPLSREHERRTAEALAARAREVEVIKALRDSGEDFTDVEDDELDMADFREEVRHSFFSPARAAGLATALRRALNDAGFEDLVAAFREPTRRAVPAFAEKLECKDIRGRLEAFVTFCRRGGFRLVIDD